MLYEAEIRKELGLADDIEITQAHHDLYTSKLIERDKKSREDKEAAEKKLATQERTTLTDQATAFLAKQCERGALTPHLRDTYLKELADLPLEQATTRLEFYEGFLKDIKDDAHAATKPQGSGDEPAGGGEPTQTDAPKGNEARADAFKAQLDKIMEADKKIDVGHALLKTEDHFAKLYGREQAKRITRAWSYSAKHADQTVLAKAIGIADDDE